LATEASNTALSEQGPEPAAELALAINIAPTVTATPILNEEDTVMDSITVLDDEV
jgi:hypothetical protein